MTTKILTKNGNWMNVLPAFAADCAILTSQAIPNIRLPAAFNCSYYLPFTSPDCFIWTKKIVEINARKHAWKWMLCPSAFWLVRRFLSRFSECFDWWGDFSPDFQNVYMMHVWSARATKNGADLQKVQIGKFLFEAEAIEDGNWLKRWIAWDPLQLTINPK